MVLITPALVASLIPWTLTSAHPQPQGAERINPLARRADSDLIGAPLYAIYYGGRTTEVDLAIDMTFGNESDSFRAEIRLDNSLSPRISTWPPNVSPPNDTSVVYGPVFGPVSVQNYTLPNATYYHDTRASSPGGTKAAIGLGVAHRNPYDNSTQNPLLAQLMDKMSNNIVGLFVASRNESMQPGSEGMNIYSGQNESQPDAGEIVFGGVNTAFIGGDFRWVPALADDWGWGVTLDGISVGGKPINMTRPLHLSLYLNSGEIYLPQDISTALDSALQAPDKQSSENQTQFSCSRNDTGISFNIGGSDYPLDLSYLHLGNGICALPGHDGSSGFGQDQASVGFPLLMNVYTALNLTSRQVGFAPLSDLAKSKVPPQSTPSAWPPSSAATTASASLALVLLAAGASVLL